MLRRRLDAYRRQLLKRWAKRYQYRLTPIADLHDEDKYLDKGEFRYILWLDRIYQKIATVPGHIIEAGVYRGRNAIIFGHLITLNGDDAIRKYYGFDTFFGYTPEDLAQSPHLNASAWKGSSLEFVTQRLQQAGLSNLCHVFQGDVKDALPQFFEKHPDFRAALLYVDCNAYVAARETMEICKPFMSPGGVVCIDEKRQGGETRALIEFCQAHHLRFIKDPTPFSVPAYTIIE